MYDCMSRGCEFQSQADHTTFVEIACGIFSFAILPVPSDSSRAVVICWQKYVHIELNNSLEGLSLPKNTFSYGGNNWWDILFAFLGPEIIELFSYSSQLSMKFFLLLNVKMPIIVGILIFMNRKIFMLNSAVQEESLNW